MFDRIRPVFEQVAAHMPPVHVRLWLLRAICIGLLAYSALILGDIEFLDLPISAGLFELGARVAPFLLPALFGLRISLILFLIFRLVSYPIDLELAFNSVYDVLYVTAVDRAYALGLVTYVFISNLVEMQRKHEEDAVRQEIDSKLDLVRTLHNRTARQLTHALLDLYMRNPSSPTTSILESAIQSLQEIVRDVRTDQPALHHGQVGLGVMTQQRQIQAMLSDHDDLLTAKGITVIWHGIEESTVVPAIAHELIFNAIKYSSPNQPIELIRTQSGSTQLLVVINSVGENRPVYTSGFGLEAVRQDVRKLGGACITLLHQGKHYALMQWPVDALPGQDAASLDTASRKEGPKGSD